MTEFCLKRVDGFRRNGRGQGKIQHLWTRVILFLERAPEQRAGIPDCSRKRASFLQADRLKRSDARGAVDAAIHEIGLALNVR